MPSTRIQLNSDECILVGEEVIVEPEMSSDVQQPPHDIKIAEGLVVIDFGSQYSHLIARRIRELKVYSELIQPTDSWEHVNARIKPKGIILSGGPSSVYDTLAPLIPDWVFEEKLPILGICYGMQVLVHQLGGTVALGVKKEYGQEA